MPDIYVTYRSGDSSYDEAELFVDALKQSFANNRISLTDAKANANILALHQIVHDHDVLIVLIGTRFSTIVDENGHPILWDAYDYLHAEIFTALESKTMRVVCVLTDGAKMPDDSFFPDNLKALTNKRTFSINHISNVPKEVGRIKKWLDNPERETAPAKQFILVGLLTAIVIIAFALALILSQTDMAQATTPTQMPTTMRATPTATHILTAHDPQMPENQTVDEHGVEMVLVPSGYFLMGSSEGDEEPIHEVCIENDFWIDRYEVTNEQFESSGGNAEEVSDWDDPMHPRTSITWFEAQAFCELRGGSLATEAQWEYAARGVSSRIYPWGNYFVQNNAIYIASSSRTIATVGSRPRGVSWVGAYNMSGNVREWTSSIYWGYPYDADDGREDLTDETATRVLRGASFLSRSDRLRSASRSGMSPRHKSRAVGFRCVRPVEE